jgi:hypothetical protein
MTDTDAPTPTLKTKGLTTFDDLTQDLVWPRLLRAGLLAFHPARMAICLFGALAMLVLHWGAFELEVALGIATGDAAGADSGAALSGVVPWEVGVSVVDAFVRAPVEYVGRHPLQALLATPISLALLLVLAAATSRSAATEFATSRAEPMRAAVRFGSSRTASLLGAILGPVVLVWLIAVLLAACGFVLFRWPVLNIVGGLFYGVSLAFGAIAVFLMFAYTLGAPMLVPAICCDGADTLDAVQRAYSYVLAKPLRLLVYAAILVVQGAVLVSVVIAFCLAVTYFTSNMSGAWAGERGADTLRTFGNPTLFQGAPAPGAGSFGAAGFLVRVWTVIPAALPMGFMLSYAACAATMLYLGMRRVCDGQDMHELWSPEEDREHALGAGAVPADNDADAE